MSLNGGAETGLSDEFLARVHDAFQAYDESGDVFARAKLVSTIGKTYAPDLLAEVERLRTENGRLREALQPFADLASQLGENDSGDLAPANVRERILAQHLRAANHALSSEVK
jgi:hypothetical protein